MQTRPSLADGKHAMANPIWGVKLQTRIGLSLCYLLGLAHWVFFFYDPHSDGMAACTALDWPLAMKYQGVLRDALMTFHMPYFMTFTHYTDAFWGHLETPLSPQFLLVPLLQYPWFNLVNVCLLYTVSFGGLLLLRRRYRLSAMPFFLLFLLFSFNGYLVSHVAVGHVMWYGCFFLPFFYLIVLQILEQPFSERLSLGLALILLLMLLQGSFHVVMWCGLFLAALGVIRPRILPSLAYAGLALALASMFKLAPGAMCLRHTDLTVQPGFQSLTALLDACTRLPRFTSENLYEYGLGNPPWEFDCYTGLVGFGLLVFFTVLPRRHTGEDGPPLLPLYFASLFMVVLASSAAYPLFQRILHPLLDSQRMPARFIVMPLTMCILLAAIRMQGYLDTCKPGPATRRCLWIGLGLLGLELAAHSRLWRVAHVDAFPWEEILFNAIPASIKPIPDTPEAWAYVWAVRIGAVISFLAILFFVIRFIKANKRAA